MMIKSILATVVALGLGVAAIAQDAAPKPARGQGRTGGARVQVCTMTGETLKNASKAESVELNGKKVLFCCADCKAKFEKLDDAAKAKAAKKADLTGQKLTAQKRIEMLDKQLKELEESK